MLAVSVSWVRNEADIIETFVRHNLRHLSRMVIVDNGSTDDTPVIVRRLREEGLPVELESDPVPVHRQGQTLTRLMHALHASLDPDWIFPLDADEFLRPHGASLAKCLAGMGASPVAIPWQTYVPLPSDSEQEHHLLRRITWRRSEEHPLFCKIAVPRGFHDIRYRIPVGSHALLDENNAHIPLVPAPSLSLSHFPVRSPEQLKRKVREGWVRNIARDDLKSGECFHWGHILSQLPGDALPTREELRDIALRYSSSHAYTADELVHDPVIS